MYCNLYISLKIQRKTLWFFGQYICSPKILMDELMDRRTDKRLTDRWTDKTWLPYVPVWLNLVMVNLETHQGTDGEDHCGDQMFSPPPLQGAGDVRDIVGWGVELLHLYRHQLTDLSSAWVSLSTSCNSRTLFWGWWDLPFKLMICKVRSCEFASWLSPATALIFSLLF